MVHSGRPKKLTLNTAFERPVAYDLDITSHWLCAEQHPRTVTLTQWNQFPRVNRCCPGIPHRRFVLRIFPGVFCTSRGVLHRRACFALAVLLTQFPGVFCTDGLFCIFSGRVLCQRASFEPACLLRIFAGVFCTDGVFCIFSGRVLRQRASFEPACLLRIFAGVFCTDGVFCLFSGRVLHRRGVSRHGVFCPRACDTAQACAPCRCVTHTRGVWR
jgi:hypothetical protein